MPFAILFVIFVVVVLAVRAQRGGPARLVGSGIPARGIILQADSLATETRYMGQRYELRNLTLDVEIPGQDPYVATVRPRIPLIVEALPGATLDLRVSRSNRNSIDIIGPAGASDWVVAAAAVPGQTWAGPQVSVAGASLPRGCGTIFVVLVGMSLATAAVLSFINESRRSTAATTPVATHAPPPKARPAPVPPSRGGSKPHPH